jgi:hypothetical protein
MIPFGAFKTVLASDPDGYFRGYNASNWLAKLNFSNIEREQSRWG